MRFPAGSDQMVTPLPPAVATDPPPGATATSTTPPEGLRVASNRPSRVLQNWTLPFASPVTTTAPSRLNLATETGAFGTFVGSVRRSAPVAELQRRAVKSELAVTTSRPFGLNSASLTGPLCESECSRRRLRTSQIRAVPSAPADKKRWPAGSNDTLDAPPRCNPTWRSTCSNWTSQSLAVWSAPPLSSDRPLALQAIDVTPSRWPTRLPTRWAIVGGSTAQTSAVRSLLASARKRPSGLQATATTEPV